MSAASAVAVVASIVAGISAALQVAVQGRSGQRIGTVESVAFAGVVAAVVSFVVLVVARRSLAGYGAAVRQPLWLWLGGFFSVVIVLAVTIAAPRIGTTATIAIFIAAQLVVSVLLDRFGWLGLERIGIGWPRALGVLLLGAGALLVLRR